VQRDEQPWPVTYSMCSCVEVEAQMNKIDEKRDSHQKKQHLVVERVIISMTISVYQINRKMEMMSDGFCSFGPCLAGARYGGVLVRASRLQGFKASLAC
jgi:hypothetical protein